MSSTAVNPVLSLVAVRRRAIALLLPIALGSVGPPALACGGLFCSANNPVNQSAERIIFADNGDGSITSIIEIIYEGPSESFSWVLPVPGVPDVGLSSVLALDRLQAATNPSYQLTTRPLDCGRAFLQTDASGSPKSARSASSFKESVVVAASGSLGPYDYTVIDVLDGDSESAATVALDWLADNDYDVSALGKDVLGQYLAEGLNLIAFRLSKESDTGSIRPVSLTYQAKGAAIPIRPTAVAAQDDMGVLVWVLGKHRAVPTNYLDLELNEAVIDWFNPTDNYNEVVIAAADEAGGQGFVTEMSDRTQLLDGVVTSTNYHFELEDARMAPELFFDFASDMLPELAGWDGYAEAIRRSLPVSPAYTEQEAIDCLSCVLPLLDDVNSGLVAAMPPSGADYEIDETWCLSEAGSDVAGAGNSVETAEVEACSPIKTTEGNLLWDVAGFLDTFDELVVTPMQATQELLVSQPTFTRLYTTLSADEMTLDPAFDFNADLESVSNLHTRERVIDCDDHWRVKFESISVTGDDTVWPIGAKDLPANQRISQMSLSGVGEVLEDNDREIAKRGRELALVAFDAGGCSCRVAKRAGAGRELSLGVLLSLFALAGVRRRKRGVLRGRK